MDPDSTPAPEGIRSNDESLDLREDPDYQRFVTGEAADLARSWGVHPHAVRPCVWLLLRKQEQPEGDRNHLCFVLAVELARVGVSPTDMTAALTIWADRCCD